MVAISIAILLVLTFDLLIIWGYVDKKKKMALPIPPDQPGMTISFNEISYKVENREILNGVTGAIRPGELLAIMGPSGISHFNFHISLHRIWKNDIFRHFSPQKKRRNSWW